MRKIIPVLNILILIFGIFFFNSDYISHFYYIFLGFPLLIAIVTICLSLKKSRKDYYSIFTTNENYSKITFMIFGILILIVCGILYKYADIKIDYLILGSLLGLAYVIISLVYQPNLSLKKKINTVFIRTQKEVKEIKFDQITKFEFSDSELFLETTNNENIQFQNLELSEKDKLFLSKIISIEKFC